MATARWLCDHVGFAIVLEKTHLTAPQQNHRAGMKHAQKIVERMPDVEFFVVA
jgi:hypothetical protein